MRNAPPLLFKRYLLAATLLSIILPLNLGAQSGNPASSASDPLQRLKVGNARFVEDKRFEEERKTVYKPEKQTPYAVILSCSDSRVPTEIVFGEWESLGKLFVIRVAGNIMDPAALGSIEYAADELKAKLIVVLGHERCGAVQAARAQSARTPEYVPPNIAWFVDPIMLAVERTRGRDETDTIRENVRVQIERLRNNSSIIRELEEKERRRRGEGVRVVGGFYHFGDKLTFKRSGEVEFF